jgi:hypothetical protein
MQIALPGYTDAGVRKFNKKSGQIVHNLNARLRKLKIDGRLPLADGRKVLSSALGKKCRYCRRVIGIDDLTLDHPMPLSRGGGATEVDAECCVKCNVEKSEFTREEWSALLAVVESFPPDARSVFHRAMNGGAAYLVSVKQQRVRMMIEKKKQEGAGLNLRR